MAFARETDDVVFYTLFVFWGQYWTGRCVVFVYLHWCGLWSLGVSRRGSISQLVLHPCQSFLGRHLHPTRLFPGHCHFRLEEMKGMHGVSCLGGRLSTGGSP